MEYLLLVVIAVLILVIFVLLTKIFLLHRAALEIIEAFENQLATDTNTLIDITSRDSYMCKLAASINVQLRTLRKQRHKYLNGDRELKEAVTNISHDLRTPLTAICGYMDLLQKEEKSENAARYLLLIENRVDAMKHLTEELFRYSVIISSSEEMCLDEVDLKGALEESIAAIYAALTKKGITPTIHIPEKKIICKLNKAALSRVFGNVLNNALKYSDGDLEISLFDSGEIVFTNSASKLNEVQAGKLFDRFFSVETARDSTGLGLSIAKNLVEKMNGTISEHYKEGKLSISINFRNTAR